MLDKILLKAAACLLVAVMLFCSCVNGVLNPDSMSDSSKTKEKNMASENVESAQSSSQISLQDKKNEPIQILGQDLKEFKDLIRNCTLLNDEHYSTSNMIWLDNENILVLQVKTPEKTTYRLVLYNCVLSTETLIYSGEGDDPYEMEAYDNVEQIILYLKNAVLTINKTNFQVLNIKRKAISEQTLSPSKDGNVFYRDSFTVYMSNFTDASATAEVIKGQNGEIYDPPRSHSPWSFDGRYGMLIYADAWDDAPPYWKYLIVDTKNGFATKSYEYKKARVTDEMWSKLSDSFYVVVQNEEKQNILETVNVFDGSTEKAPLSEGNIQILGEVDGGKKLLLLCDREGRWNIDLFSKTELNQKELFNADYSGLVFKLNPNSTKLLLWRNNPQENVKLKIVDI